MNRPQMTSRRMLIVQASLATLASVDADFGRTYVLLPNPMYGAWTTTVTRIP